jgi:hypothetical protein
MSGERPSLVIEVVLNCVGPVRSRQLLALPHPRRSATKRRQPAVAAALARHRGSFIADRRGAVAFETIIVYLFIVTFLLLPLTDVAAAGFQFISAWGALRGFGQYVQYNTPPDPTNTSSWTSALPTSVAGYPINNVRVLCGDTGAGVACTSTNIATSPTRYYAYTTTVTVAPIVLRSVLCTSGNANPCSYTLPYSERFQ